MTRTTRSTKRNCSNNYQSVINKAIICGSFNPFHEGHIFLIKKALKKYQLIYLVIAQNEQKPISNKQLIKQQITDFINLNQLNHKIKILINEGYLANFIKQLDTNVIIRGFRNKSDLSYEIRLKKQYLKLNTKIKFVLYKSPKNLIHLSSSKLRIK